MTQPIPNERPLPKPPYYAVIFSSQRTTVDAEGYAAMAARMEQMASEQPGYLGIASARNSDGFGITVSYWDDLGSIRSWYGNVEHRIAQEFGKSKWYQAFQIQVSKVERANEFRRTDS